jgi:hypothetical protein
MDKILKDKWLGALRSGKYIQNQRNLIGYTSNGEEKFCVLGLLCHVYDKAKWLGYTYCYKKGIKMGQGSSPTSLPVLFATENDIKPKIHITDVTLMSKKIYEPRNLVIGMLPLLDRDGGTVALSRLNDSGMSFEKLADLIEYFY